MKELLDALVNGFLQTKWSRLTAGSTLTLSTTSVWLPELLEKLDTPLPQTAILPVRIIAPLAIYSIGCSLVLILEVIYNRSQRLPRNQKTTEKYQADSLDEIKKRILSRLARGTSSAKTLSRKLDISSETLTYHIEQMPELISGRVDAWNDRLQLTKTGRQVAVELGLLDAE